MVSHQVLSQMNQIIDQAQQQLNTMSQGQQSQGMQQNQGIQQQQGTSQNNITSQTQG